MNTPPARRPLALALAAACWLAAGTALAQPSEPAPDGRAGAPAWPTAAASPPAPDPECASAPESIDWASAQRRLARCNRDLRVALRATESALADVRVAGQRPNPTLSAGIGNVNPQLGLGGANNPLDYPLDYIARLDQTFERGGKRGLRIESAEQAWSASRWNAADTLRRQQLALAQAWIALWGAQERVRLQQDVLELFRRALDAAQRRLKAGDIAAADVSRIELDMRRAEAERTVADGELVAARNAIASLLAIDPPGAGPRATEPWPATDAAGAPLLAPGEAERPDLQAARAQQAAADAQSRLARSQRTRDVTIGVQAERYAPPAGGGWLLGAFVSVPLFVNHRYEGEIARAEADREVASENRARIELQARAEQRRLLDARAAARARRERIERDALPLAEKVAANAELAWRKGAGTVLELLDALRQLRALQIEALQARLDDDRADAAARAEMLTAAAAADPVFGESLRLRPTIPDAPK
ncbi:MAG: TolC family protein [Burkholderiaceae bacterium]|jgi:cobalt-zinc-cadmium efflux system outer membrane protein|nr:TolC family protein [Burkholderiales bacterium]MCZ8107386.1 TolC family protein [Burkholderiales bacterium]MCZ8339242.1 TolC family protein [Burkholderiaceae bacterium]